MRQPSPARQRVVQSLAGIGVEDSRFGGYLYRPGELLVKRDHNDQARRHLDERTVVVTDEERRRELPEVVVLRVSADVSVPRLIAELSALPAPDGRGPLRISPNHVFAHQYVFMGGDEDEPVPAAPLPGLAHHAEAGVVVAVVDTPQVRHSWLADSYLAPPAAIETDDHTPGDDAPRAHGTFVAGVVVRHAHQALIEAVPVLDRYGFTDDVTLATGLANTTNAPVINLSLGGYTFDDRPPLAVDGVLGHLAASAAIVCAAGNNDEARPFWPAADYRLISVAALDPYGHKAHFSNFGPWVRACALGMSVHSTFPTFTETIAGQTEAFTGWARWDGTSFAAPLVAGRIAALMDAAGMGPHEAATAVLAAGTPVSSVGVRVL